MIHWRVHLGLTVQDSVYTSSHQNWQNVLIVYSAVYHNLLSLHPPKILLTNLVELTFISASLSPCKPLPPLYDKCIGSWRKHFRSHTPPWPLFFLKTTHANFIILRCMRTSFLTPLSTFPTLQIADGNAEASYRGIRMGQHREQISSSIQEMMAGPNTILNRTRGDAGYKSILSPNDDHHLEHIFRAHCCLDVWLSSGSHIHKTTHWSYVEVTFKRGMLTASSEVSLKEN